MAVVERFKEESMYGLSARTKEFGHCREVAVVELKMAISVVWALSQLNPCLAGDQISRSHISFVKSNTVIQNLSCFFYSTV